MSGFMTDIDELLGIEDISPTQEALSLLGEGFEAKGGMSIQPLPNEAKEVCTEVKKEYSKRVDTPNKDISTSDNKYVVSTNPKELVSTDKALVDMDIDLTLDSKEVGGKSINKIDTIVATEGSISGYTKDESVFTLGYIIEGSLEVAKEPLIKNSDSINDVSDKVNIVTEEVKIESVPMIDNSIVEDIDTTSIIDKYSYNIEEEVIDYSELKGSGLVTLYDKVSDIQYPCIILEGGTIEEYKVKVLEGMLELSSLEMRGVYYIYFNIDGQMIGIGAIAQSKLKTLLDAIIFKDFNKSIVLKEGDPKIEGDLVYALCQITEIE